MQFLNFTYVLMDFLDAFKCFQKSIYEFLITFSYKDNIVPDSNVLVSYIGFNFIISQTQMKTTLINNYVPSGNVEDIEHIDIAEMNGKHILLSLGACFYDGMDCITFDQLYRRADIAMYDSKKKQGYSATIFDAKQ